MKRLQNRKLWLLILAVLILLAVAVVVLSESPHRGVSVTFQHFIHNSNGRMALFSITNQWGRAVRFDAGGPCEVKVHGVWKDLQHSQGSWGKAAGDPWESDGTLQPGASVTVAVVVPEGIGDWRAAVRSGPPPRKLDPLLFHLRANWKALREFKALPGFKGSFYCDWPTTNYSQEFFGEFDRSKPSSSSSSVEIPGASK
jgi:hypothetical protein